MEFWNSILTEKSWKALQELKGFKYVLIGGWATYMYTKQHKSKDIDIILKDFSDLSYLRKKYDLKKNDALRKYEIEMDGFDIDIYVPYFSSLCIPVNEILRFVTAIESFSVVKPEVLLILKQGAEIDREHSVKGEKDRIDIMTLLLLCDMDFKFYHDVLREFDLTDYAFRLKKIIKNFQDEKYLNITPRQLKIKKKQILGSLRFPSK